MPIFTHPNPDLVVGPERQPRWNLAARRRASFHGLQHIARYSQSYRAGRVLDLRLSADLAIAAREDLRHLTSLPWFSAMAVTEGNRLLHQSYAPDF
ncbi:MAG: hypothetical protein B7Y02_09785, partial [Rhodobacterales bacterium 17-64-5]